MNRRAFLQHSSLATAVAWGASRLAAAGDAVARPIRIAQIGVTHSHAAVKWATLQRQSDRFTPVGIWEPDPKEREKASGRSEYAGVRWLEERELFGDPRLEAVAVETELPDLLAQGRRVIEAGWHLHLDKPPGRDLAAFVALQEAAAQKRRVLQTGYMYRHHPAFRFCLEAVRAGWLGRIFSVHGEMGSDIAVERRAWLAAAYGGSTLLLGCHLIDIAIAILGEPTAVIPHRRRSFPERDAYSDHEITVLEYPQALAVIRSLNVQVGAGAQRQFLVSGENGTLEILPLEPARVRLTLKRPAGRFAAGAQGVEVPPVTGRYDEMMADFARMIRGAPSAVPQFDAAHERRVHRAVLI